MATFESVAYLKGLMDGLGLDDDKKETKIFRAIVDVLDDLSIDVDDLTEGMEMLGEQIDAIDEDLGELEECMYDDECGCSCCEEDDEDVEEFEVECPLCHASFCVDEDTVLEDDVIACPACGEKLEFDVEFDEDEAEDEETEE